MAEGNSKTIIYVCLIFLIILNLIVISRQTEIEENQKKMDELLEKDPEPTLSLESKDKVVTDLEYSYYRVNVTINFHNPSDYALDLREYKLVYVKFGLYNNIWEQSVNREVIRPHDTLTFKESAYFKNDQPYFGILHNGKLITLEPVPSK